MKSTKPAILIDQLGEEATPLDHLVTLWSLRLFLRGKGYRDAMDKKGRMDRELADILGFGGDVLGFKWGNEDADPTMTVQNLGDRLEALEREGVAYPPELEANVSDLAWQLGFARLEAEVAAFIALSESGETLHSALTAALRGSGHGVSEATAVALDQPRSRVVAALHPEGRLRRSGLVQRKAARKREWREPSTTAGHLDLEGVKSLGQALLSPDTPITDFLRSFVRPASPRDTGGLDFEHIQRELEDLTALVQASIVEGSDGLNILLHGAPGVGKTALAHALTERAGACAFEVPTATSEDESLHGWQRFRAAQMAQYILNGHTKAVLVFDEVEDVFARGPFAWQDDDEGAGSVAGKGWVNRLLEQSPVPTIWVANSLSGMDAAFVRRFDYLLELRCPPRAARERLLEHALDDTTAVSSAWIQQQAASDGLTPAQIDQAGRLAKRLESSLAPHAIEPALTRQLRRQQRLQGHKPDTGRRAPEIPFDLHHTCTDPPPQQIAEGLATHGEGSVLMHGPPGTGKTAFAHAVAERLQCPLIARRASDLLSCLVGNTEANLAAMFEQARDLGAVLFIDEADSFLHSRESAVRRWEVTETNELLCQIESQEGVLLIATNLASAIDPATMRRFDVKMGFDYPDAATRWALFERLLAALAIERPSSSEQTELKAKLDRLDALTPGDFATVARRVRRFWARPVNPHDLVGALSAEQADNAGRSAVPPGFLKGAAQHVRSHSSDSSDSRARDSRRDPL